jgi:hypothetical protein
MVGNMQGCKRSEVSNKTNEAKLDMQKRINFFCCWAIVTIWAMGAYSAHLAASQRSKMYYIRFLQNLQGNYQPTAITCCWLLQ